jgi:hypothetical protein
MKYVKQEKGPNTLIRGGLFTYDLSAAYAGILVGQRSTL